MGLGYVTRPRKTLQRHALLAARSEVWSTWLGPNKRKRGRAAGQLRNSGNMTLRRVLATTASVHLFWLVNFAFLFLWLLSILVPSQNSTVQNVAAFVS